MMSNRKSLAMLFAAAALSACGGGSKTGSIGAPPPPPPATNFALRFFGTGANDVDRVKIALEAGGVSRPVNIGATDFTIEFWIKGNVADNNTPVCTVGALAQDAWINGNIVIDRDVFGDGDFGDYGIALLGGRVAFGVNRSSGGATLCGGQVLDGMWHHVAVIRERATGEMRIFVDGAPTTLSNVAASLDVSYRAGRTTAFANDPFLVFGAEKRDAGAQFPSFNGLLDDVRLSSFLRYTNAFARPNAPLVADGNTVALYSFNEGSGTTIIDSAGGSDGVRRIGGPSNGPQYVTDTPF